MSGYYKTGSKISVKKVGDKYFMFFDALFKQSKGKKYQRINKSISLTCENLEFQFCNDSTKIISKDIAQGQVMIKDYATYLSDRYHLRYSFRKDEFLEHK
ncbi:hypothetical protein [Crassaminicella profunda]|uniref:hypothetical protein n=1 Tax=Crassaminicella profunda TaxID=1286698 RepID=UPI001CA73399|nr:hypothetical protein [Crassaminicella profunda]QZY54387.1 hypothetical protein K7H06_15265 [Crassaminicella profunda]